MIRVGVVGLGEMGQHHARVYAELGCQLVGVADTDPERARRIAQKYNVAAYQSHEELVRSVDAVSIAVPTSLHHTVALDFLRAGVHCLVEKPIAATVEDAREMIEEAARRDVKLMVGHIERFNPAVTRLKEMVDRGVLGELIVLSTRRVGPGSPRIRDVGIVIDSATHDIDIARHLMGREPVSIFSQVGRFKHQTEDHAIIVLVFGSTSASIEVNWFSPHKVRSLVATGSEGIAYLDYLEQKLTVHNAETVTEVKIEKREPLKLELEQFVRSVEEDASPPVDGYEGLKVLEIALKANEASANMTWAR